MAERRRDVVKLHTWQAECLEIWIRNGCRGMVNAVTGTGKTLLALAAIRHLEASLNQRLQVKIVVPQTFLVSQWRDEIKHHLHAGDEDIGIYSGKRKEQDRRYTIYVVNSARYSLARHILMDIHKGAAVFLIADECHHYGSEENRHIFDFVSQMEGRHTPYYALGLSATPEKEGHGKNEVKGALGEEIYLYDFGRALKDRIISPFILFSIRLSLVLLKRQSIGN